MKRGLWKKGLWKKGVAMCLAAAMGLGLVACDRGESGDNPESSGAGDSGSSVDVFGSGKTTQLGKENVYSFQDIRLTEGNDNITDMVYQDGKLYLLVYNGGGSGEESSEKSSFGCYRANVDGSDSCFIQLPLPERTQNYSWIDKTLISSTGQIYAVENSGYEDAADPDNYVYEDRYYLNCWDMEGNLQWTQRLDSGSGGEWIYCSKLLDGGQDGVFAIMSGSYTEAVLYSPQGEESRRSTMDNKIFERAGMMYAGDEGKLTVIFYDEDYTKRSMTSYDLETGQVGEQFPLPFGENYNINSGSGEELILTNELGLFTWNAGDEEPIMLMSIVNSDLPAYEINRVQRIDDQHFVASYNELGSWEQKCAYFTYMAPADIPDKEELVLGGMYIGSDIKAKVIEFNKASDQYRITLKDYSVYNTDKDRTSGQSRLGSDIVNGQMPDIMLLSDMNSYGNYVAKGLLADIGSLLEADQELGGLEYLENVWDAYSVNGKLYAAVSSFNVRTMMAKKSLVGEPTSWTMADLQAILDTMPQGATAFGYMVRDTYIYYAMSYAGQDFVDVNTGKCNFDSQGFVDMLEYARTLPKENPQDYDESYYNDYENRYRENRVLLYDLFIGNMKDCKYQIKGDMGEAVSFVGFPTSDSNGSVLSAGNFSFMISARSENTEGAWQFVRQFLTPEYQSSTELYNMPVLKSAFLAKAQDSMERPYWTDENGNREYYDDTWHINGEEVILEPFTQEEVDQICQFIYSVNRTAYYNEEIYNIIIEEAEAFFTGQKSVQEVVDIIQSRAQIYVDENR